MAILTISHVMKSTGYEHQNRRFRVFRQIRSESSIQNRIAAIVRNHFKLYEIKLVSHLAAIPSTVIV